MKVVAPLLLAPILSLVQQSLSERKEGLALAAWRLAFF